MEEGRLKPGEQVFRKKKDGKIEFSGLISVMEVNALLAKVILIAIPRESFTSRRVSSWTGCIRI